MIDVVSYGQPVKRTSNNLRSLFITLDAAHIKEEMPVGMNVGVQQQNK
jgi:hypothetical protein